jgi:PadR family transcriptional regulator, regulatory protein PadR
MPEKKSEIQSLSALEEDLLTLLYARGILYGTQFISAVSEASERRRQLGVGSLYPTLARLHEKGLVEPYWGDEERGPRRKYYKITDKGRESLEEVVRFRFMLGGGVNLIDNICGKK